MNVLSTVAGSCGVDEEAEMALTGERGGCSLLVVEAIGFEIQLISTGDGGGEGRDS